MSRRSFAAFGHGFDYYRDLTSHQHTTAVRSTIVGACGAQVLGAAQVAGERPRQGWLPLPTSAIRTTVAASEEGGGRVDL